MKRITIALLLIACSSDLCSQSSPPATPAVKKWVDGLDARKESLDRLLARLKAFANGPNGNVPGAIPRSIGCPVALESALVAALTDAHIVEDGKEEFHLVIHGQRDGEYLDVSYTYNQRGALLIAGINKLPAGWQVGFQSGEANVNKFIIVTGDSSGCIFEFDTANPFASKAIAQQ